MSDVLETFQDIRIRLHKNKKTGKIEMGADVKSVFDIAWYTFARLVADVAPPIDEDLNYFESQGSVLTCMTCGEYFVRHSSRQRYCDNPNCKRERNNQKAGAYHERKKGTTINNPRCDTTNWYSNEAFFIASISYIYA